MGVPTNCVLVEMDEAAIMGDDDQMEAGGTGVKAWARDTNARTETEAGIFMVFNGFSE